jgi:5-methylcytosine-specific restriction endonuclease McrA
MYTIISREEAKAAGDKFYFTGEPCKRGHLEQRRVSSRACVTCGKEIGAAWVKANPERQKHLLKSWRQNNLEQDTKNKKNYYQRNKEAVLEYAKAWKVANLERKRATDRAAARRTAARRRLAIEAQLKSMCNTELLELRLIYDEATLLGPNWHVDHIVPLSRGGEHRPYNLQIVNADYNVSKNAKLWYTPADLGKHLPAHYAEAAM